MIDHDFRRRCLQQNFAIVPLGLHQVAALLRRDGLIVKVLQFRHFSTALLVTPTSARSGIDRASKAAITTGRRDMKYLGGGGAI
jgi:hypothetical protein